MSNVSYTIKGQVWKRKGTYYWSVRDSDDQVMAAGEEHHHHFAFQNTYDVVSAIRAWIMFGRGDLRVRNKYLQADFKPQSRNFSGDF